MAPQEYTSFTVVFNAAIAGNVTNVVIAGSNMTGNVTNSCDAEIVNKTEPTPGSTSEPTPKHDEPVTQYADKHATGNPIILLLLVIMGTIPIRIRKK